MHQLIRQLKDFKPWNEQEEKDIRIILEYLQTAKNPFLRENEIAHMTASSWIVNPGRTKVLMVYHNIYDSWSWTGGHADGDTDLLAAALREASEETGITDLKVLTPEIFSVETLMVAGHQKKGKYVSSHLHMNVTYLLEASEEEKLTVKPEENSGVKWIPVEELEQYVSEPWMMERIYKKLIEKQVKWI